MFQVVFGRELLKRSLNGQLKVAGTIIAAQRWRGGGGWRPQREIPEPGTFEIRVPLSVLRQLRHDDALQAAGSGGVLGRGQR